MKETVRIWCVGCKPVSECYWPVGCNKNAHNARKSHECQWCFPTLNLKFSIYKALNMNVNAYNDKASGYGTIDKHRHIWVLIYIQFFILCVSPSLFYSSIHLSFLLPLLLLHHGFLTTTLHQTTSAKHFQWSKDARVRAQLLVHTTLKPTSWPMQPHRLTRKYSLHSGANPHKHKHSQQTHTNINVGVNVTDQVLSFPLSCCCSVRHAWEYW